MMSGLGNRLALAFLAAVLIPLALSLWVTTLLLERSLLLSSTREIDELSRALEDTGREFYRLSREQLRADVAGGRVRAERFSMEKRGEWPAEIETFWASAGETERFRLAGDRGNRLELLVRRDGVVLRYARPLGAVRMDELRGLYAQARERVETSRVRDLRRGFLSVLWILAAVVGVVAIAVFLFFAHRISRPVKRLTDGLRRFAAGDLTARVEVDRRDEIGAALDAFNHMAAQLEQSRERLVMLTRLASWQALGRKMAHEVKNSLTPIRLAVEEIAARKGHGADREFFEQASALVVEEVNRLEKRVRAFSELAAEPPVHVSVLDVHAIVQERIAFLRSAHPAVLYDVRLGAGKVQASGDEDLVRGVLTNLLENAAEAAGAGGVVLIQTRDVQGRVEVEVHDSGPGLSLHARETLFEPTISFKKTGMGLGLSIARKGALLSGGDLELIAGELGGAAFRLTLNRGAALSGEGAKRMEEREPAWVRSES
jgi:nitrogen fixation/metabolism regulation signal transduction histidine kinase